MLRGLGIGLGLASLLALPVASEVRIKRAAQPLTDAWRSASIEPRRVTLLGLSYRPPQVEALGLDAQLTLRTLLAYPFQLIRLGAYWNRMEPAPGAFDTRSLDWQVEASERAGKQIVLCVGALKTFGYPEFFAPAHHLPNPLPERTRIRPVAYQPLLTAATDFITRIVDRYKAHTSIVAWQVEHEAVDPLGMEHSWRLDVAFVE
jgi:beta-galactosidase GanA